MNKFTLICTIIFGLCVLYIIGLGVFVLVRKIMLVVKKRNKKKGEDK